MKREVPPPEEPRYDGCGCWSALLGVAVVGWMLATWWVPLTTLAILLTAPLAFLAWDHLRERSARRAVRSLRSRGIRGLVVYSQSPVWREHIETNWLQQMGPSIAVLDWSERRNWREGDVRVRLFRRFVGSSHDYNPAAIVFRARRPPLIFRFYGAFRNAKHGNVEGLMCLERQLFDALAEDD